MFNEAYIKYSNGDYRAQTANFIHEVLHALYFEPDLFQLFAKNSNGDSFLFKDANNKWKVRGTSILQTARNHYGCSTLDGGKYSLGILIEQYS